MMNIKSIATRNIYPIIVRIEYEDDSSVDIQPISAWDKDDNVVVLDENKIRTEMTRLQAEYEAQAYARKRQGQEGYPSVGDQLDMLMKDMKNNTTTHQESCEAVKLKYPKSE